MDCSGFSQRSSIAARIPGAATGARISPAIPQADSTWPASHSVPLQGSQTGTDRTADGGGAKNGDGSDEEPALAQRARRIALAGGGALSASQAGPGVLACSEISPGSIAG